MNIEQDRVEIVSGVRAGVTMGGPITLVIRNKDWENWSDVMHPTRSMAESNETPAAVTAPRPGHADLLGGIKWHHHDLRNVLERASARETAIRVALGALVRQLLEHFNIAVVGHVIQIGEVSLPTDIDRPALPELARLSGQSEMRCFDGETTEAMKAAVDAAREARDTLGGVVELIIAGLPVGLGSFSQWYRRLDGRLAGALMAIPSVKGVEVGLGFRAAGLRGSRVHDEILYRPNGDPKKKGFYRTTNSAGGIEGGITNGEDVVLRIAGKPLSTLRKPLKTVDVKTKQPTEAAVERSDACIVPALAVICEQVAALVVGDAFLEKFGADNFGETKRNFEAFLSAPY